jgi:hypothetical protein
MKRTVIAVILAFAGALALPFPAAAADDDAATMSIARFVTCQDVMDREPLGESVVFPPDTAKVYAFLDARDISADVTVNFVWLHEGQETARVALNLRQGPRWRTWSSKKIAGRRGKWRVELRDNGDNLLTAAEFVVE